MAFCRNCGKEIEDEVKFCPYCGAATDGSDSVANNSDGGIDYSELKFSAALATCDKNRKTLIIISIISLLLFIGELIFLFKLYKLMGVFAIVTVVVFPIYYIIIFKKQYGVSFNIKYLKYDINSDTTIGDLRKLKAFMNAFYQFTALPFTVSLIFGASCGGILGLIVGAIFSKYSAMQFTWLFKEPEFFSLLNGSWACAHGYYSLIALLISIPLLVCSIYLISRYKKFYRYFKGKLAPEAPEPIRRWVSGEEKLKNEKLVAAADALRIGDEFDKVYNVYAECFSVKTGKRKESGKFNLKTDAACTKYAIIKWCVLGVISLAYTVAAIVWLSLASSHASVKIRPGSLAKIELGYSASQVESVLGEPDEFSTPSHYIYADMSDVDNAEDLDEMLNAEVKQIIVFFDAGGVTEIRYDSGKSAEAFEDDDVTKEVNLNGVKDGKIAVYKDGSIRIYIKSQN